MGSVTYTKTTAAPNGGTHDGANSHSGGLARNGDGQSFGGRPGAGRTPLRHIDDLISVGVDIDPHTPLRKVLELGDAHMRQAITYNDFRRPDLALQEYIKAFTIAVDKVPRHKEYPSMKSDRGDLNRLYNSLKLKITTNGATFDKVKNDIKEDNQRSGVQPTNLPSRSSELALKNLPSTPSKVPLQTQAATPNASHQQDELRRDEVNTHVHNHTNIAGLTTYSTTSPVQKSKPVVQPKPQALHGKAIGQVPAAAAAAAPEELTNRFARLRDPQQSRQLAKPIAPAKPIGARDVAIPYRSPPPLETSTPVMPKLPDAIYSPARGTVTSEVANLPSSTPRGMFSRTNSITSTPSAFARESMENAIKTFNSEQFVTAHTYGGHSPSSGLTTARIPSGDTITVSELSRFINHGSPTVQILLIDIRDRESFDEGRIKSHRTICVEPEILMRQNISAEEIADSMVLAPPQERLAMEQRDKVDLVVIYDEDSTAVPTRITGNTDEMILYNVWQALSYYSYSRPLKNGPKLLVGGLDSWVDHFGEHSLETSDTWSDSMPRNGLATRRKGNTRRSRTKTKTLNPEEIKEFEDIIMKQQAEIPPFDYARTRDEFVRRFPSVAGLPESMISPAEPSSTGRRAIDSDEEFMKGIAPTPPKRPAPAIPRTRYSGLESKDDDANIGAIAMKSAAAGNSQPVWTGLVNAGTWCYSNSTIQALAASPFFMDEMVKAEWPATWRPQTKPGKGWENPQLMARVLGNLLQWMDKKQFAVMQASTFMHYVRSIHVGYTTSDLKKRTTTYRFGDGNQHDADDFTRFVFDQLTAETNMSDDVFAELPKIDQGTFLGFAVHTFWEYMLNGRSSFIDKCFTPYSIDTTTCKYCGVENYIAGMNGLVVYAGQANNKSMQQYLQNNWDPQTVVAACSRCGAKNHDKQMTHSIMRLPPLLRIPVVRQQNTAGGKVQKTVAPFSFPFENLDLSPYTVKDNVRQQFREHVRLYHDGDGLSGPSTYDLYAVIVHQGDRSTSGHYWTWLRSGPTQWIKADDNRITTYDTVKQAAFWKQVQEGLMKCSDKVTPVSLWYKRKDVPWRWENKA
ncbi:hypothetical protein F4779DRAFT_606970 [Xylariaceae sp. FL0662B]|nr:hypothetical protein F4779DRAFT_606970 [Xylariaceae sp. FL0662B]